MTRSVSWKKIPDNFRKYIKTVMILSWAINLIKRSFDFQLKKICYVSVNVALWNNWILTLQIEPNIVQIQVLLSSFSCHTYICVFIDGLQAVAKKKNSRFDTSLLSIYRYFHSPLRIGYADRCDNVSSVTCLAYGEICPAIFMYQWKIIFYILIAFRVFKNDGKNKRI